MSRRKERIIAVVVIVVLIASLIPINYFLREVSTSRKNVIGLYAEEENTLDMVYIGGSVCFNSWMPLSAWDDYGYTSYNFAVAGLTPQGIKYMIEELYKTQQPSLLVIDLRPFQYGDHVLDNGSVWMYSEANIRHQTDSMNYSSVRRDMIDASVQDETERLSYYVDFLKKHYMLGYRCYQTIENLLQGEWYDIGYLLNCRENRLKGFEFICEYNAQEYIDCSDVTAELQLSEDVEALFIDLLEYCSELDVEVLFVVNSYCQTEENKMQFNYMARVIAEYGFDYLNLNDYYEEIGLDYSYNFRDTGHVNILGAEKCTDFLAAYIDENYDLPDHRSDPAYAEWDVCAEEFAVLVEDAKEQILSLVNSE